MILVRACACVCAVHVDEDTLTVPEDGVRPTLQRKLSPCFNAGVCVYVCVCVSVLCTMSDVFKEKKEPQLFPIQEKLFFLFFLLDI